MNEVSLHYYLDKKEPAQSCLLALQSFILKQDDNINESIKWGLPCFSYKNKMFCFLNVDKKTDEPYILFVEGIRLKHPELEQGDRSRMKIYRINPNSDLPVANLKLVLTSALELYKSGIIKTK